jgi:hypothetical protein
VLCPRPKNSIEKSIAIGTAATKSHFRAGVSVDLNDLTKGYATAAVAKPA